MGCIISKPNELPSTSSAPTPLTTTTTTTTATTRTKSRSYRVWQVDDSEQKLTAGHLRLDANHLSFSFVKSFPAAVADRSSRSHAYIGSDWSSWNDSETNNNSNGHMNRHRHPHHHQHQNGSQRNGEPTAGVGVTATSNGTSTETSTPVASAMLTDRSWLFDRVRRFGYRDNLFTFVSGSRCAGGAQLYLFRCRNARDLYRSVCERMAEIRDTIEHDNSSSNNQVNEIIEQRAAVGRSGSDQLVKVPVTSATAAGSQLADRQLQALASVTTTTAGPPASPSLALANSEKQARQEAVSLFGTNYVDPQPLYQNDSIALAAVNGPAGPASLSDVWHQSHHYYNDTRLVDGRPDVDKSLSLPPTTDQVVVTKRTSSSHSDCYLNPQELTPTDDRPPTDDRSVPVGPGPSLQPVHDYLNLPSTSAPPTSTPPTSTPLTWSVPATTAAYVDLGRNTCLVGSCRNQMRFVQSDNDETTNYSSVDAERTKAVQNAAIELERQKRSAYYQANLPKWTADDSI